MKTLTYCLILLALSQAGAQTIRVANNNTNAPTGTNIYTTLQAAIDAAASGDIIHVIASKTPYGNVTIDKKLTVYGIGFNPDKDIPLKSDIGNITLRSANASGCKLSGLLTNAILLAPAPTVGNPKYTLSNVIIEKCQIQNAFVQHSDKGNTLTGLLINACFFQSSYIDLAQDSKLTNAIIGSNIFSNGNISAGNGALIVNNLFVAGNVAFNFITNCLINNNIFYGCPPTAFSVSSANIFNNNISFGTSNNTFPPAGSGNTASNNKPNVDPQFVKLPLNNPYDPLQHNPTLKTGSPAEKAGSDGKDIGIFGGVAPFSTTGTPLPLIQVLNTSGVINKGSNLQITIKAKAN